MIDIAKQVAYWREGAEEDWAVACELLDGKRTRHGLFLANLALEKLLKAFVCKHTQELAPRMHNLVRLAELACLRLRSGQLELLAEMNEFNVEGRYPGISLQAPTPEEADDYMGRAKEVFEWLTQQL